MKIGILDYGMGNLRSVYNALDYLGADPVFVDQADQWTEIDKLLIPGVGAYAKAMQNIQSKGFDQSIEEYAKTGKPILGICLGMQLLSDSGTEPTWSPGLGLIPGTVEKLIESPDRRIPHMGWNSVSWQKDHYLFNSLKKGVDFYFVHSYHFVPKDSLHAVGTTDYLGEFTTVVSKDNVTGVQFHPEKSQKHGLKILENFCFSEPC